MKSEGSSCSAARNCLAEERGKGQRVAGLPFPFAVEVPGKIGNMSSNDGFSLKPGKEKNDVLSKWRLAGLVWFALLWLG